MKDWLENQDLKFITQLNNFAGALPAYAATFGLNPTQVTAIQNDAAFACLSSRASNKPTTTNKTG
jgi:hypothetical protein